MRKSHSERGIRSKTRIELDGEPVFGRSGRLLFETIDARGPVFRGGSHV